MTIPLIITLAFTILFILSLCTTSSRADRRAANLWGSPFDNSGRSAHVLADLGCCECDSRRDSRGSQLVQIQPPLSIWSRNGSKRQQPTEIITDTSSTVPVEPVTHRLGFSLPSQKLAHPFSLGSLLFIGGTVTK